MVRNCNKCGIKITFFEKSYNIDSGQLLCQSCYERYLKQLKRQEIEEKKKEIVEKRKKTLERNRRKRELEKKREQEKRYGKKQELEKWKNKGIAELIRLLGNQSYMRRRKAALTLGELKDKRAVRPLIEALKDRDIFVVAAAVSALGKIGEPRALDDLHKLCNKKNIAPLIYRRGISAIDKLKKIKFERMAKNIDTDLKKMSWQDFEDTIIESLDAVPSDKRTSDMGIDGITKDRIPIQIKQSERIGRNVIDNFETALRRFYPSEKKNLKGIIVAFSFTKGAYDEVDRARREDNIDISLIKVDELVS